MHDKVNRSLVVIDIAEKLRDTQELRFGGKHRWINENVAKTATNMPPHPFGTGYRPQGNLFEILPVRIFLTYECF